jgi:hypothetical protein
MPDWFNLAALFSPFFKNINNFFHRLKRIDEKNYEFKFEGLT